MEDVQSKSSTRTKRNGGVYADWRARRINHDTVQQETESGVQACDAKV